MERIPRGIYTPEFRAEAVKAVEAEGLSIDQMAKRLSVAKSSLSNWVRAARAGEQAEREITEYIEIFYIGFESRHNSAICRPPLSVSDTMQCRWSLNPLDSTICNRHHLLGHVDLSASNLLLAECEAAP